VTIPYITSATLQRWAIEAAELRDKLLQLNKNCPTCGTTQIQLIDPNTALYKCRECGNKWNGKLPKRNIISKMNHDETLNFVIEDIFKEFPEFKTILKVASIDTNNYNEETRLKTILLMELVSKIIEKSKNSENEKYL